MNSGLNIPLDDEQMQRMVHCGDIGGGCFATCLPPIATTKPFDGHWV